MALNCVQEHSGAYLVKNPSEDQDYDDLFDVSEEDVDTSQNLQNRV